VNPMWSVPRSVGMPLLISTPKVLIGYIFAHKSHFHKYFEIYWNELDTFDYS
jgi:hypothetical protein